MKYLTGICFLLFMAQAGAQNRNAIVGKWESAEKNLIVEVYEKGHAFEARIVWFHDDDDTITSINQRLDVKNPNKALRNRPIIGMDVLSGLQYNAKQNKWTGGRIYDSSSGKTWDATIWLAGPGELSVRGFYLVRWLGKTLNFTRI